MSGVPPRSILYTDPVSSDPKDDYTRLYRRRRPDATKAPDGTVHVFEASALHWGGLTTGHWTTAFWMLLSPFAFANVAGWMTIWNTKLAYLSIRLAGLGLTGLFVVQLGYIFLEIPAALAWADLWRVLSALAYLAFVAGFVIMHLSTQSHFHDKLGWADRFRLTLHPASRFMLPRDMWNVDQPDPSQWEDPAGAQLDEEPTWGPHAIVNRIRRLHLATALLVIATLLAVGVRSWWIRDAAVWGFAAVVLAMALTSFAPQLAVTRVVTAWLPLLASVLTSLGLWEMATGSLPSGEWADITVVTFAVALILGAASASTLFAGLRSLGSLALGALFGGSLGIGGALILESAFGLDRITAEGAGWVAVAMLFLIGAVLAWAVVVMLVPWTGPLPSRGRLMAMLRRVTQRAQWLFIVAALYGLAAGAVAFVGGCVNDGGITCDPARLGVPQRWDALVTVSTWLIILIPTWFIIKSLAESFLTRTSNRHVGILWDLASFWPRWFHPLAPPAYGPKIVEDLAAEIADREPELLEAHSQGSVIAAATLATMEVVPPNLGVITYGSPLGILYQRLFPKSGVGDLIDAANRRLGRKWRNLWRGTDPLGGEPIGLGEGDVETTAGTGHSLYERTRTFKEARLDLVD